MYPTLHLRVLFSFARFTAYTICKFTPGPSAWRAMLADQLRQKSRSSFSEYQMPLPLLSASASPEHGSTSLALLVFLSGFFTAR